MSSSITSTIDPLDRKFAASMPVKREVGITSITTIQYKTVLRGPIEDNVDSDDVMMKVDNDDSGSTDHLA